jgi:hypothetical protein
MYEGGFSRDAFEGKGRFTDAQTGNSYVGDFKEGQYDGVGTFYYGDGRAEVTPFYNSYHSSIVGPPYYLSFIAVLAGGYLSGWQRCFRRHEMERGSHSCLEAT